MSLLYRAQQWDNQALMALDGLRGQAKVKLVFNLITRSGNGLLYVAVACLVGLFDSERFATFPVLSFWVAGQFEQYLNAWHVERMGLGRMVRNRAETEKTLADFLHSLDTDRTEAPVRISAGNQAVLERIDRYITSFSSEA